MAKGNAGLYTTIGKATTWSGITEIVAKLITPLINMILARLLTPEVFGIVATVTMVFSFADMFTDAGFQKYIVQREFKDDDELFRHSNVAFWANFSVSLVFWAVISLFSGPIAKLVGCEGMGSMFIVSCISLPLTAFSSIQMAIYRRKFDFKTLFRVRMVGTLLPLFVTVPLAYFTRNHWALIIGSICGNLANAVMLTLNSQWKPKLFFSFRLLKEMLSFSVWSLMEAVSIWLTNYIGVFLVGTILSQYYLGLYKTAMSTVNQITSIVTATVTPVMFASLSRLQRDREQFNKVFFDFQRITSYFIVPAGIGILLYRDLVTDILLGSQWTEAAGFVGLWGLISSVKIIYSNYCYEVYRAYAKPKLAVFAQVVQLVVLVPGIFFSAKQGFVPLYIVRSLITLILIIINQIIMKVEFGFSFFAMIRNTYQPYVASFVMCGAALLLQQAGRNFFWQLFSIAVCVAVYFGAMMIIFPSRRAEIMKLIGAAKNKFFKKGKKGGA